MTINVLYVTRNGLLEPLGQSQVFAYLRGLSRDHAITLITYEKDADRADRAAMEQMRARCRELGIRWLPQRFRSLPRVLAAVYVPMQLLSLIRRTVRRYDIRLIHARSYVPAAAAMVVGKCAGVPFIFDMRALWPEELVTAGRLRRGSVLHRAIVAMERACLQRAAAVVSLTHAAAAHLRATYPRETGTQRISVIPTCVDLDRFTSASAPVPGDEPQVIGCLGTVLSGWFRMDWFCTFVTVVSRENSGARFAITTRDDAARVYEALGPALADRVTIRSARPEDIPSILRREQTSVMFYAGGNTSELGRSPTRLGEILGCGKPVIANAGVGDVARIVEDYRIGVLARDGSEAAMLEAWHGLQGLLTDPDLAARCRRAAEEVFSLDAGTRSYREIYRAVTQADARQ
ncbi:glycosyltransferase [Croceicoccus bisphenolivorans]|uniref:glycosyltransferase n=1 Tax=Croceicoccus bisphenolivorans TaxID=1783232 RepID=UPI00083478F2|nr:glycosyltransferase [Croceicoccus bisphenolivorans]